LGLQERVRFAGRVAHAELASWFACASVFCLPSHAEGVPNVVLEAMACGTPVVATDVGGIGEILPAFAGHLVPVQDVPTLTATIVQALATPWDRERIVAHMKPFDWDVNVSVLKGLIEGAQA
jgi:glycosyltransferase involved in cell wall biosynthesis